MFGRSAHDRNLLFCEYDWFSVERYARSELEKEINKIDSDRLLNSSIEDLCDYFEEKYKYEIPKLIKEDIFADQKEIPIDVSRDSSRFISNPEKPYYINGTEIKISIPFEGDPGLFKIRPTSFSLTAPNAEINGNLLIISIKGTNLSAEGIKRDVDRTISEIENNLSNLNNNTRGFNSTLRSNIQQSIEQRREKLLKDKNLLGSLGFNIKERPGNSSTYITHDVKRKISPTLPTASTSPYKPEPILADKDYEHILDVIQNMVLVMERSPSAFKTMDEESIRSHFLVQLNGHYEGQATGETFNYDGKTDILIRSNGKNIFIAECKFWSGPKKLIETIDQLLGYSSWRDTKVAIIIFNRNKDFTNVLKSIDETAKTHSNHKRKKHTNSETSFKYIFSHRDDKNRELVLTIIAFDVPS